LDGGEITYVDELESFYWILCYIVVLHEGPGLSATRLEATDATRFLAAPIDAKQMATDKKGNLLWKKFVLPVQDWFGEPIQKLTANLHSYFHRRIQEENMAIIPSRTDYDDYKEFIDYFVEALGETGSL